MKISIASAWRHFVNPFLLVRCPVRPAEFFHLPLMAKLRAGPAFGAGCLFSPLPQNHHRDNHSLGWLREKGESAFCKSHKMKTHC
jgi:hypothetical protein